MQGSAPTRQDGAVAILFCLSFAMMLGMLGLALDLAQVYQRRAELQALADAAALAAAAALDGTPQGVAAAVTQAATTADAFRYQFDTQPVAWSSAALRFGGAADAAEADWVSASAAEAAPVGRLFARVDTAALAGGHGTVTTTLLRLIPGAPASASTSAHAVAGRSSTNVLPLAICAQSGSAAGARANVAGNSGFDELVEYGFRRGVGYDLMQLNPNGTTAENFLIDPMAPPGVPGSAANLNAAVAAPFVCAGSMPMSSVLGGALTLRRGFPIDQLYHHLNSRFDDYDANACTAEGAPPDANIKPYPYDSLNWMSAAPAAQTAERWTSGETRLWTRADPLPGVSGTNAPQYGALWSYARAVPYAAYAAAAVEPAAGYTGFAPSAWLNLYTPGPPSVRSANYPAAAPYQVLNGSNFLAPSASHRPGLRNRRVLNVALLACPVPSGGVVSVPVLAVARFFMTVKASSSAISGEFAGVAPPASLGGTVELQR